MTTTTMMKIKVRVTVYKSAWPLVRLLMVANGLAFVTEMGCVSFGAPVVAELLIPSLAITSIELTSSS
jgi:hypothetical protein